MKKVKSDIGRREFLKRLGLGATVVAGASIAGCKGRADSLADTKAQGDIPTDKMTYRVNHNTGDSVSLLGYGMMRLPTTKKTNGVNETEVIDQEMVNRLVDYAMAHGVNYYDTSPAYCGGKSEESTGIALSRYPRDKYYIATKLSNFSPESQSRENSILMFENSLRDLRTDYVDYLLLHAIGGSGMPEFNRRYMDNGILDWLIEQKEKGRIRNLGFSYHGAIEVFDTLLKWMDEGKVHWDFVQIQLNYIDWLHAKEINAANTNGEYLYAELQKRGIPAVIMEPLLGGRLASLPAFASAMLKRERPDKSIASWAFRYAGTPEGVLTCLSGMTYMEHLEDNLRTFCPLEPCTDHENEILYEIADAYVDRSYIPCTGCQYCMPCPYGIDIPKIFGHYNKCINEGNYDLEKVDPKYAEARRAFLVGYDRTVPKLRQADHCIGCGHCVSHCPQRIMIPREMHRIDRYVEDLKRNKA